MEKYVFASSKYANLTQLPLEIITHADYENSMCDFDLSEKR